MEKLGALGVNLSQAGSGDGVIATRLPTADGLFELYAFPPAEHLALVRGPIDPQRPTLLRVHSECLTGEVFGSLRCDCNAQLHHAQRMIQSAGSGILLYLRQEGRGIGLLNKLRAYQLQDQGRDTLQANLDLGLPADGRDYAAALPMLRFFGVRQVRLLTNNPLKVAALQELGIEVVEQVPIRVGQVDTNAAYLATKRAKMGHLL